MHKHILVTGGTGFLGSYIIRELISRGYRVRAIRRSDGVPAFHPASAFADVEWVDGDILDVVSLEDAMQGIDAIIHSAALVSFSPGERKNMYHVNVDGTANVVNMALELGVPRLVHISSVAAIGRTANGHEVNEERKWEESKLNTHYAISKHKAEMEVWRAMGEGLDAVILNPSTILGYGDWKSGSAGLFRSVAEGFPWYSAGINGFVDVQDVARAAVLLMESGVSEERFIVNGENWSFRKLLDAIADSMNRRRPQKEATPMLTNLAWRMEKIRSMINGRKPVLTKESARVAQSRTLFENHKLLKALPGFTFTPLEDTIRKAGALYAANNGVSGAINPS